MYPIAPKSGALTREFLYCVLLSETFTHQAIAFQVRTGIPKINRAQLGQIVLPKPPVAEQEAIARALLTVEAKIQAEETRTQSLSYLFDSLLHELMTGKLRVGDLDLAETPVPG